MAKSSLSIGDDTPTGEPENGPRGPYISDMDDGGQIERMFAEERERRRRKPSPAAEQRPPARPAASDSTSS